LQLLRNTGFLYLDLLAFGNILTNTKHAHNVTSYISAGGRIQQNFDTSLVLGVQWKFEVGSLPALQSIVQYLRNTDLIFFCDEILSITCQKLGKANSFEL
jgi:hypothetical protein